MSDEVRAGEREEAAPRRSPALRRAVLIAAGLAVAFLAGFLPMWLRAREGARQLEASRAALRMVQLEADLAAAAVDARRAEYEPARRAASEFYNGLRAEADRGEASALTPAQRQSLEPIFRERDEAITLLARSDPAAAELLARLYVQYRQSVQLPR